MARAGADVAINYLSHADGAQAVRAQVQAAGRRGLPVQVLGGGSNVIFPDAGFPGVVLRVVARGVAFGDEAGDVTVTAAAVTVVFVTRSGLAVHGTIIELLHLIGAEDRFIARQFEFHALKLGFLGSLPGLALAAASLAFLGAMAGRIDAPLLPRLTLAPAQWAVLAILPLVVGAIAMVTARVTVMRRLARMI